MTAQAVCIETDSIGNVRDVRMADLITMEEALCCPMHSPLSQDASYGMPAALSPTKSLDSSAARERLSRARQLQEALFAQRMRPKVRKVLRRQSAEVAQRIASMQEPVPMDYRTRWTEELYAAMIKDGMGAAIAGWEFGGLVLDEATKQDEILGIAAPDDFVLSPTPQRVDKYFTDTASKMSRTKARKVNQIFDEVQYTEMVNPETGAIMTVGRSPANIAREMRKQMTTFDNNYSDLVARTGVVWANNEAAMQRYKAAGIKRKIWWTTTDELTCPYCEELHDTVIEIDEPFLQAGAPLTGTRIDAEGEEIEVMQERSAELGHLEHPPAHPNCRCSILASIDDLDYPEGLVPPERLPEAPQPVQDPGATVPVRVIDEVIDPGAQQIPRGPVDDEA